MRFHSVLAATALFAGLGSSARAGDWYVDASYTHCNQSDGSQTKPFCTINGAVAVAAAGDTIHVAQGTYHEAVHFTIDLTLIGTQGSALTTIDLGGSGGFAWIDPGLQVSLEGLTIRMAWNNGDGGAASLKSATLEMIGCVVDGCFTSTSSYGKGGGVYAENSTVTLVDTLFTYCAAYEGAGVYVSGGTLVATGCTFDHGNSAGGMGIEATAGAVITLTDCSLHDGNARGVGINVGDGGGVLLQTNSVGTITRCTFTANVGDGMGGGVYSDATSSVTIEDSTFDSNVGLFGGGARASNSTLTRCTFHANHATPHDYYFTGIGGALYGDSVTVTDCVFDSNVSDPEISFGWSEAGGAWIGGTSTVTRCRFTSNTAGGIYYPAFGGGVSIGGNATLLDCEIVGNTANAIATGVGGEGGGAYVVPGATATFTRCTLGGNQAAGAGTVTKGGSGGGLFVEAGGTSVTLSHVVVAGNTIAKSNGAPDIDGAITTADWNDVGNTTGCTIHGTGANDLLNVDPLFVDPSRGDFSLQAISPCVDSGDPTALPTGKDVGANPRLLDGNLDRVMVVDRGAREFDLVHFAVTGQSTPGGTLTFTTTGSGGLPVLLFVGLGASELRIRPFGALFVDLAQPYVILNWGTIPSTTSATIDPSFPAPLTIWLQELAVAGRAGDFSNLVEVDVE